MRKFGKVVAIVAVVVVLATAAVAAVAVAQEGTDGVKAWFADRGQEFKEAVAGILGISVEKYDAALDQAREEVLTKAVEEGNLTQEQADRIRERADEGFGPGMMGPGMGRGMMGRGLGRGMMGDMMGDSESSLLAVAADKLGMTVEELQTQLKDGKTVADLAKEKGVDVQTIVDAFLALRQEVLSQAVTDGKISQEQADQMLKNMREMIEDHLNGEMPMSGPGGCGGRGGRGMMGGWDGDDL
jgi:polyhydroxyalkanoate synthesis regulator phasin